MPFFGTHIKLWFILLLVLVTAGCGYRNPYVTASEEGVTPRTLYLAMWDNQTNELGLETVFHRTISQWLMKSSNIILRDSSQDADFTLSGRIISTNTPGLSYGTFDRAVEFREILTLTVTLRDNRTKSVVWEEPEMIKEESFSVGTDAVTTLGNKNRALQRIANKQGEELYYRILTSLLVPQKP